MSISRRPGGLTVFAIFNFLWALMLGLNAIGLVFQLVSDNRVPRLEDVGGPELVILAGATGAQACLLLVAGIGYLKLHRLLGFWGGIISALLSIVVVVLTYMFVGQLSTSQLIGVVYAPLTVLALTFPFRRDFFPTAASPHQAELDQLSGKVLEGESAGTARVHKHPTRLLAATGMRFGLRRGDGTTLILLTLLIGVLSASTLIDLVSDSLPDQMQEDNPELIDDVLQSQQLRRTIASWTGSSEEQVTYLMKSQPAVLSGLFVLLLWFVPFISMGGAFNLYAGDIKSRGLRFLLLRTERKHIFLGRFLSVLAYSAASFLVLVIMVTAYVQWNLNIYEAAELWAWALQGFAALILYALPYLALCALVSVMVASPTGALFACLGAILVPVFVVSIVQSTVEMGSGVDLDWVMKFLPWGWRQDLLHGDLMTRALAIGVMLGFTAGFLFFGLRRFNRRDL